MYVKKKKSQIISNDAGALSARSTGNEWKIVMTDNDIHFQLKDQINGTMMSLIMGKTDASAEEKNHK